MKKSTLFLLLIAVILFFIPFFWFKPGELDLGGDSSRLYFYDPLAYLHSQPLYSITTSGIGGESISYYSIPFVLFLAFIKYIVSSPTIVGNILQGITLSGAFLAWYFIIKELFVPIRNKKDTYVELVAMLSGLYYIFSPTLVLGWDKAILTHYQFFLNPLIFLFLLKFLIKNNIKYLFLALVVSFLFAANFSFVAAPPFFAFYPLAIIFLLIYTKFIAKKTLPTKKIIFGFILFFLVHLFHLGPHIWSLFSGGSEINNAVFSSDAKFSRGLSYFSAIAPSIKVSFSWMNLAQMTDLVLFSFGFIIFPLVILLAFFWNKGKLYLLTSIFFLITLFFVTANITDIGLRLYKRLFDIPGFSMFRNFFGQWIFVYTFFYTLLLGQALFILFQKIKKIYAISITAICIIILLGNAWPFITGSLVNKIHYQSKNIKIPNEIDPEYGKVLTYIRTLPQDGKFISFPLAGPGYQTLIGANGGAYQGPSTISYLTGKNDFTGYDGLIPFNDIFLSLVKNHDYQRINRLFAILNIKYIFYNSDPLIYDNTFPQYPYEYVRDYMPKTQAEYKEFLSKLPVKKIKSFGQKYHIYEVNNTLPHIYIADNRINSSDALTPYFTLNEKETLQSIVFTDEVTPKKDQKIILEAVNRNPLNELINNYHLHVHEPFISRRPDDLLYPLVVRREKSTLEKRLAVPNDYLDFSLLYLSKRVYELEKYKETPITYKAFSEPALWQIYRWRDYYSWEAILTRYKEGMKKLITWVPTAAVSDSTKNAMKIKINQNLAQHEMHLARIIKESLYADKEKLYLSSYTKKLFAELYETLDIQPTDTKNIPYSLEVPVNGFGVYEIFLKSQLDEKLDASKYTIMLNGSTLKPLQSATSSSLIEFGSATITNKNTTISLQHTEKDLIADPTWVGTGNVAANNLETTLTIDNQFENGIFAKKIKEYKPSTQYVITFDYYTEGTDVIFRLYEKQKEKGKLSSATYFNKNLSSRQWKTNQGIVTSAASSIDGFIQFAVNSDKPNARLHIRNLSVIAVPNERIIARKVVPGIQKKILPDITFKKHNPTHYTIHVKNAHEPYTLVFSEKFSDKWKLFMTNGENSQVSSAVASHFDGQIKEEKHTNAFFDKELMTLYASGQAISEGRHSAGNGYANVWEIHPEDVNKKENYDLQLEFLPQKNIYLFLGISSLTVLCLLIYIIFYRKKEK